MTSHFRLLRLSREEGVGETKRERENEDAVRFVSQQPIADRLASGLTNHS